MNSLPFGIGPHFFVHEAGHAAQFVVVTFAINALFFKIVVEFGLTIAIPRDNTSIVNSPAAVLVAGRINVTLENSIPIPGVLASEITHK